MTWHQKISPSTQRNNRAKKNNRVLRKMSGHLEKQGGTAPHYLWLGRTLLCINCTSIPWDILQFSSRKVLSIVSYWSSRRRTAPSPDPMPCRTREGARRWMRISVDRVCLFIYLDIYLDVSTALNNGADVTCSNWLVRSNTMARALRRIFPSFLLLSTSVTNSRLQIWNLSRSVNPT